MQTTDEMSDEALFGAYSQGDAAAFDLLYRRYRQSLYLYLLRSVDSVADAEELYQDAWSRVISATKPFSEGSFKAYLFRIARNLQIDRFRRARLQLVNDDSALSSHSDPADTPEQVAQVSDCGERLKQELGELPPEQREAFLLKEEGGFTLEQIAALVSVGRETVKSRLRYALKQLRKLLEDCL
jgi:RNA polymerase sigma-70 factor (ECF subfamily)